MPVTGFAHLPEAVAHFSPVLADFLVASLWQGAALVLLTACFLRLLPSLSASVRSGLWTGVLLLTALLPLAPTVFPSLRGTGMPGHGAVWHLRAASCSVLISLWVVAAAVRTAQLAASAVHLRGVLQRAEPMELSPALEETSAVHGQAARVCLSPDVDRPSVAGFLHPCILLPPDLPGTVSEAELGQILLHEREHLRRGDHWVNLLGQISLVLFPLSPALIWLNRRLALERELACDDRVLASTGARKAYAACLARVAERSLAHRGLALAISILGARRRGPDLVLRVERILAPQADAPTPRQSGWATGVLCTGVLAACALLARSPELVSFAPLSDGPVMATAQPAALPALPARDANAGSAMVPVVERRTRDARAVNALWVRRTPAQARSLHLHRRSYADPALLHSTASEQPSRRPYEVLQTQWRDDATEEFRPMPAASSARGAAKDLRVVPVLLRVASPDPEGNLTWYPAFRLPDGWVVVVI